MAGPTSRLVASVLSLAAAATLSSACSSSSPKTEPSTSPRVTSSTRPGGDPVLSQADARTVGIYAALLRQQLAIEGDVFPHAFVGRTPVHAAAALSAAVRRAITAALPGFDVHWVSGGAAVGASVLADGGRFVPLPALPPVGDRLRLSVSDYCGNVCGHGASYVVTRHGTTWIARQHGAMGMA
jgi:hypothetical protein